MSAPGDNPLSSSRASRRDFLSRASLLALGFLPGVRGLLPDLLPREFRGTAVGSDGRLKARPHAPTETFAPGTYALERESPRDGQLYLPASYSAKTPAPLVLALHGAGGSGRSALRVMQALADERGVVILAPDSRGGSWDAIRGTMGPDV